MLQYLNSKLITYIEGNPTKEEALKMLVELIKKNSDALNDENNFYENILAREELGSTGIGQGIAIPHARSEKIKKLIVAIGLLKNGVDFNSLDGEKVKLIILVGSPKGQNREYLSLVSELMRTFRNEKLRENVICTNNYQELLEAIAELK
ncbi:MULTISPECIES: PTS sugar transporter subunit IIA [unclassified Fusobacterium]|uniref:PTS sugar transporter subunit IIA n=1 Tax=unclassified Fusobacterium TaxID=2648384 RepID=UPI0025C24709|nr:PTS sugar transporter subunit IIA [Fusobacterium sp.]